MDTGTTFIIADNQPITRAGLQQYIVTFFEGSKQLFASSKKELSTILDTCCAGVVILDYALFDFKGIEDLLIMEKRFPQVHWILFFNELSEPMIRQVQGSTSISLLAKDASEGEIISALQAAVKGEQYICQEVQEMLQAVSPTEDFIPLTASETEILKLIAHGKSVKEIATLRHSSIHTIVTHKKNLFRKLQVNNVYEATKYAIRAGLVDLIEYYI